MALCKLMTAIRDFFSNERLEEAKRRHSHAADNLDKAVKEMLDK